jgi:hypothetical protein
MMRFARLLIVFALLTPLATIYAECAWVFWMEVSGPRRSQGSLPDFDETPVWGRLLISRSKR